MNRSIQERLTIVAYERNDLGQCVEHRLIRESGDDLVPVVFFDGESIGRVVRIE